MTKSSLLNLTMPPILSDSTHKVNLTVFGQVASENFLFIRKQLQRKFFFVHTYIEILKELNIWDWECPEQCNSVNDSPLVRVSDENGNGKVLRKLISNHMMSNEEQ